MFFTRINRFAKLRQTHILQEAKDGSCSHSKIRSLIHRGQLRFLSNEPSIARQKNLRSEIENIQSIPQHIFSFVLTNKKKIRRFGFFSPNNRLCWQASPVYSQKEFN